MRKTVTFKTKKEFYKMAAFWILLVSEIDLQAIVFAPYFGVTASEAIGLAIISEIIAVFFTYCVSSFKKKREEERIRLIEKGGIKE